MTATQIREPHPAREPAAALPTGLLPVQLTRFIGREHELDDLTRLLRTARLATLTGAGGSGKTRLAWEAAARTASSFEGVTWVDLSALVDPAFVPQQVALALGVHERPGSIADAILDTIGDHQQLLVLDSCEHLVEACADLVTTLLTGCPRLTAVATSREALGVPGETAWLVPALVSAEAVQLFVERAQAVLPGFLLSRSNANAVEEICRRLDGIPLAIELAAARVRVLTPDQIAERLSDAFRLLNTGSRTALPRHRTLRGTMDWSFALLNEREQTLLRRLSVFAGSFGLEAAEAVCTGAPLEEEDILDGVSALVDKSLVSMEVAAGEARYRLLETVRQYGGERLREANESEAVRSRHAAHFLVFAETAEPHLFGGAGDEDWLSRVSAESGNLIAVADWAAEDVSRTEVVMRIASAIHWFWFARGQFRVGRQRLASALATGDHCHPHVRARALIALGHIALWQGDRLAVRPAMEESMNLLRSFDDPTSLAYALNGVGAGHFLEGNSTAAEPYFQEALDILRSLPLSVLGALLRYWHGQAAQDRGDLVLARSSFEEAERIGRELRHRPAIGHALSMLGWLALFERRYRDAFEVFTEGLAIHHDTDDGYGIAQCLEGLAAVAVSAHRFDRAVRLAAASDALRGHLLMLLSPRELADRDERLRLARQALGDNFDKVWSEGARLAKEEAIQLALADIAPRTAEFRVPPTPPVRAQSDKPDSSTAMLRVLTLGPLQVFRDSELIEAAAWGSARPRELLVFLLMHTNGCTKEQVGLAFWPDASSAQLRNSFHVTLHRLRKALRHSEWLSLAGDRYQLDPAVTCEFDVTLFEREVGTTIRGLKSGTEEAGAALERALARYRGDFLDGEPAGDWHLTHREGLQRLYVEGLLSLGGWLSGTERYTRAAEAYRRVLARDELHEESWRQLMLCHARMGERSQAIKLYQRLVEVLRRELDAEPESRTTELYQRLQRGES